MAINPSTQYPGQVEAPSVDYPYGGGKNETVVDALDGTPFEKAMLDDIFGFQQSLLSEMGITPSGNSETALVSQYLEAIKLMLANSNNLVINGNGVIQQRADYALVKDAYDFGPDRFEGMATGTLVTAGDLEQTDAANIGVTGFAHKFTGVTLTGTGIIYHRHRIESKDAKNLKNLVASLACEVYHNVGSAVTYTLFVRKADAEDDFSAVTAIGNDGGTSVSSATPTTLKFEDITMGDCSNGIEIELKIEAGAITTKDFEITEYRLNRGALAPEFKVESIGDTIEKCERFAEKSYDLGTDPATVTDVGAEVRASVDSASNSINSNIEYKRKRVAPTVTAYNPNSGATGTWRDTSAPADVAVSFSSIGESRCEMVGPAITVGNQVKGHWFVNAEL